MHTTDHFSIRRADDRGRSEHGWLDSRHSFSFGGYQDPAHAGFRSLRVINEDRVAPLGGFPTHPHRDMEIFSYVVSGRLAHRDSLSNEHTLEPGEIQLMSAGSGVTHSEFNPSADEPVHFLQIWIHPRQRGLDPRYSEWRPAPGSDEETLALLISPDGRDGSAVIARDAEVHRLRLAPEQTARHHLADGRGLWIQMIRGRLEIDGVTLESGDGAATEAPGGVAFRAGDEPVEALLFDLGQF